MGLEISALASELQRMVLDAPNSRSDISCPATSLHLRPKFPTFEKRVQVRWNDDDDDDDEDNGKVDSQDSLGCESKINRNREKANYCQ